MTRPFLMVFTGRSGSSSLMYDLDRHPKTIVHMELFGERLLPQGLEQTDDNRIHILHELWGGYTHPEWLPPEMVGCARGFKLQFKRAGVQFDDPPRLVEAMARYRPLVIALRRRDLLRQAISKVRALALAQINAGEWGHPGHHIAPQSGPRARAFASRAIRIAADQLQAAIDEIRLDRSDLERFCELAPPEVEIAYEDYLADPLPVLNAVLEALALEPFRERPPATLMKITDDDWRRAVENPDEVEAVARRNGLEV